MSPRSFKFSFPVMAPEQPARPPSLPPFPLSAALQGGGVWSVLYVLEEVIWSLFFSSPSHAFEARTHTEPNLPTWPRLAWL